MASCRQSCAHSVQPVQSVASITAIPFCFFRSGLGGMPAFSKSFHEMAGQPQVRQTLQPMHFSGSVKKCFARAAFLLIRSTLGDREMINDGPSFWSSRFRTSVVF